MRIPRFNRLTGFRWWKSVPERDDSDASRLRQEAAIRSMILNSGPCAMGKIGTTELLGLEYLQRWFQPLWPQAASWHRPAKRLYECSGLFPVRQDVFFRWAKEYESSLGDLDLVAQWQVGPFYETALEAALLHRYCPRAVRVGYYFLRILNPRASWLDDLAKLRWLVIHPFEKTIRAQLPHLAALGVYSESAHRDLECRARDTSILACPQLPYMVPPRHRDWFETLEDLKFQMSRMEYDIALVGAGAWSVPLVAHAKSMGKKGIHLGGSLQLMFGIKGGRFDDNGIYNSRWTRPVPEDSPDNRQLMEKGAYW
jgi:hypothetical protein